MTGSRTFASRSLARHFAVFSGLALLPQSPIVLAQVVEEGEVIEEIITTGTAGGAEMRKFDASFAITTVDDEAITEYSPQSTADLLKLVPGVWSESSGGVSGANVFVRGFPGGGDAPFLTVQVNGAPVFPPPTLSFLENTTLFRIDETVMRMEALRGGPNPVFSNGQPGLTTNFILREGTMETDGLVKYTMSDYDLRRFDGYLSGELAEEFYYMIGGYISSSPGIRDAGFNSDEGNQFTINLTKDLDNGTVNVFHRQTDDQGQWYLPVALNVPGGDASYNQLGTMDRQRSILTNNNGGDPLFTGDPLQKTLDLGEGRGWSGSMTGGSVTLDISDDWTLTDRFSFTGGDADTLGLVPDGGAVQVGALLADPATDPRAVVTGPITGTVTGRAIGADEYIQQFGAWEVRKDIEAFTNDISLARNWDRGTFTLGYYSANSSSDDVWALGNSRYEVVQQGGEVVTGIACNDPTVDSCGFNYDIDSTGDATTMALYAATTIDLTDRITVDAGVRGENHQVNYSVDVGTDGDVDFAADFDETEVSWTAALNLLLTDSMGGFARINSGRKMPYFDDFRDNQVAFNSGNDLIQQVDQYELGFKWMTDALSLYATGFYTEVDPTFFVALVGQQAVIQTQESMGVEVDAVWETDVGFAVSLNATVQETEIVGGPNDGNETQRQPGWQVRLTPSWAFDMGDMQGTVYGTVSAVDDRWGEPANVNLLDGYEKLDLGIILRVNEAFVVQLAADNVTDEDALTESDPRTILAPNGRYIMPRTFEFSVGYEF
jgi:outer membrane receptor protein involved in Fe transport